MTLFWDTSAILPLVFREPHSQSAHLASQAATASYAWRWLSVEAAAGLSRRRATHAQQETLRDILAALRFVDLPSAKYDDLTAQNRDWRLRAADAGHLYCFRQVLFALPDVQLVCFDAEIHTAARAASLPLWTRSNT
jgi:predicted nucleic acid-binding protein